VRHPPPPDAYASPFEGVKLNGRRAILYSKLDIGCALGGQTGIDCKGYTYESALRVVANTIIDSTLPW